MFYIFQYSVGDMEFELMLQRFIGIVVVDIAADEKLRKTFELGNAFFGFNFAWNEDIKEVPFFFVCKVGIEPMEHL